AVDGDFAIGGVPGTGARIDVDFADFSGSAMGGNLLPTGNPRDTIDVPGIGALEVSIVDMANLLIFAVAPPLSYLGTNKHEVGSDEHDLFSRSLARYEFSKAYP